MDGGQNTNGGINGAVGTGNPVVGGNDGAGGVMNAVGSSGSAVGGSGSVAGGEVLGNPVKSASSAPQGGGLSW